MSMEDSIKRAEEVLLHTYNRYPIVLDRGEGVYLYDAEGKKYLDFASGIGVFALGYGNQHYNDALSSQIGKLIHTSNYYYNEPATEAAEALVKASGMDRVFFTNSGAEAVEGALKAARRYAFNRDKRSGKIIALEHSFHGRTMGALSVTGKKEYRDPFEPLVGGIEFVPAGDLEAIKRVAAKEPVCGVILEPVQGEGGIYPMGEEFLRELRSFCTEQDILLIFDEIQCGMGRSGEYYVWQHYGVKPDILTTAKALGCGFPVGAFLLTEETAAQSLAAGDHGSTYAGNPLAGAAVREVLAQYEQRNILAHVKEITPYLEEKLEELRKEFSFLTDRRGLGLMQGLESEHPVGPVILACQKRGMLMINAGSNVLRFLPPLIIEKEQIDEMQSILREALTEAGNG